ncbi:hypothetical protein [Shimia sagamensis]|uniref:hypothetical protein n=1 Tax=Shimia sagamensis TaxID=1566352 RepID=UPI0024B868C1|nr:hypothetical protein [Shimia sagamensis]
MSLIVVTDIHGAPEPELCLGAGLPVALRLSLAELCGRPDLSGENLHHYLFQAAGMAQAVTALSVHLSGQPRLIGLGYSAGGTALWKAAKAGGRLSGLVCVSSTRLRDETALSIPNQVYFGDKDLGRPSEDWLATVPNAAAVLPDAAHAFYAEADHPGRARLAAEIASTFGKWNTV